MKKILLIYPHNFLDRDTGTNIRIYQLAKYLVKKGYSIDLYACKNLASTTFDRFDELNREKLVDRLYLYDFLETQKYKKNKLAFSKWKNVFDRRKKLDNYVTPVMLKQFAGITQNGYDYVIMFYLYTAELLKESCISSKKVYFMEDCLSVNQYTSKCCKELGGRLNSEMERLSYFDDIVCISHDEKIFFEKVVPEKKYYFVPHLVGKKVCARTGQKYDVLFIGADNHYNIDGIHWFFAEIYPHLQKNIKILIAGKVVSAISSEYQNVSKIEYVEDLDELYPQVKISICPLLNGTGMKIKVIEAMSYGIPVVCTSRGVDGFPDKNENGCLVTDDPSEFAGCINRLVKDEKYYEEISGKEYVYFTKYLSQEKTQSSLDRIF